MSAADPVRRMKRSARRRDVCCCEHWFLARRHPHKTITGRGSVPGAGDW